MITLDLPNLDFYCPATGKLILDSEKIHEQKSLMGYWIDEFVEDAYIFNKDLEKAYSKYLDEHQNDDSADIEGLIKFLEDLTINPHWVVFCLPDIDPLGPCVYVVIDLNTQL